MTDEQMKVAFENALLENPNDVATRKAFSDYLEEQGEPEQAAWHRNWPQSELDDLRADLKDAEARAERDDYRCSC